MIEDELFNVKEYKFDDPLITDIDSVIVSFFKDCHNNFFHGFDYECVYDIKLTNITDKEENILTMSAGSMSLNEINKKNKVARHNGFIFLQLSKITIKFYSHLRYINISYYLNFPLPMCH